MPRDAESIRRRIKGEELAVKLQAFALNRAEERACDGCGHVTEGKVPKMSSNEISAALGLLNKVSPNLKSVDMMVTGAEAVNIRIVNFSELPPQEIEGEAKDILQIEATPTERGGKIEAVSAETYKELIG